MACRCIEMSCVGSCAVELAALLCMAPWACRDTAPSSIEVVLQFVQGLPGLQGLATGHPILSQHPHHPQHPIDPYVPLMPSLSLDSFFASYDERDLAAQRAQAPPPMMENVLPAWEDLSNGPSGSLQGGPDWRVCNRAPINGAILERLTTVSAPLQKPGSWMQLANHAYA